MIGLSHFLVVSAVLFVLGLLTIATRRNAVGRLMGVALLVNAAGINLVAFSHYGHGTLTGQIFTLFILLGAASQTMLAVAIIHAVGAQPPDAGALIKGP
jgi:NADH-quinone oxidoreductase subunit K